MFRRLGASERADVYLGVPSGPVQAGIIEAGTRPPVALKIFRPETAGAVIEREFRVLTETTGGRFASLVDVATLSDGRVCFVQEHLSGRRLSRLLGEDGRLAPGEAVTILAPILAALAELLALGYVHEGLSPSAVIFDPAGRPVLTGLGRLRELPPPGPDRRNVAEEAERRVTAFALGVLDRVEPGRDAPVPGPAAWLGSISPGHPLRGLLDELERRLFAWAPATAVAQWAPAPDRTPGQEVGWASRRSIRGMLAGGGTGRPAGVPQRAEDERRESGGSDESGGSWRLPGAVGARLRGLARLLADARIPDRLRDRGAEALRAHRGPILVGLLLAAAGAVLLLTLGYHPVGGRGNAAPAPGSASPAAPVPASSAASSAASPRQTPAPIAEPGDAAADVAAVEGDEPVPAVRVLLRLRAGCIRAASVACLDGVDQAGSAALASDGQAARAGQQGESAVPVVEAGQTTPTLVERRGDVALVAVVLADASAEGDGKPASVLVVKGEAGWRIRQIFDY
ncbi:hypothetical protein [Cryobacterium fucosi]|uniref:Protein kinase domain-containing protein n=1 Tax=Cryobacterium fucosi TaxID=1259157 RepID=A0A4R9BFB7_9MICO|nr:hypothetical protein [Cryobacterium fucosi]TFD82822.1 hypothetical protein E3T48_01135 [Cryobacterium fucosi]